MRRYAVPALVIIVVFGLIVFANWTHARVPLVIQVQHFEKGVRELVIEEKVRLRERAAFHYVLHVESRNDKTVHLKLELLPDSTKGITAKLALVKPIMPTAHETVRLVVGMPPTTGPFRARIKLYSDELPGWSDIFTVSGNMVDEPIPGRRLELRPAGVDLGKVRVGEVKDFEFRLGSYGDKDITVFELRVRNDAKIQFDGDRGARTIPAGGEITIKGRVRITSAKTHFEARIDIHSDAANARVRTVTIAGEIQRDYTLSPPNLPASSTYAHQQQLYSVQISAAEGIAPFTIAKVAGLDPLFELVAPPRKTAAARQTLTLRLRKGAPTDPKPVRGKVRIELAPSGIQVEWPYRLRVLPPIYAQPAQVDFGRLVGAKMMKAREVTIQVAALPGRTFEVKSAKSQRGLFGVRIAERKAGMPWQIVVTLDALPAKGTYRDHAVIETTDEQVPKLLIPIRAFVR